MVVNMIIAFDFSINKPACTIVRQGHYPIHLIWPLDLTKKEEESYADLKDVECWNRNLDSISKKGNMTSSDMAFEHTKRSLDLANKICFDLQKHVLKEAEICNQNNWELRVWIASEALSFASKGNSTLDLATYKGVLLAYLYKYLQPYKICTYAPMTIKSIAGCAKKDKAGDKNAMINAFMEETYPSYLRDALKEGKLSHVKVVKKTGKEEIVYNHCVDDIVDSYFAAKTCYKKEGMSGMTIWKGED